MLSHLIDIENWREIGATLSRNKTRTFLTAFGIFWGTAMLAMLMGGASGLRGMLMRNFDGFATNMGGCFANRTTKAYHGFNKGMQWRLDDRDVDFTRRACPVLDLSTKMTFEMGTIKYGTKSTARQVLGVEGDYFKVQLPVIDAGRVINASDDAQIKKVAVIGRNVAAELSGQEEAVGQYIAVNGVYFKVVGVVGQTSEASIGGKMDDSVILPSTTLRRAYNKGIEIDGFIYTAKPGHTPKEIEPIIRKAATTNHPLDPDDTNAIAFMDISENFKMVENLFTGISLLAFFVGIGTLLAGIIGIGNIMWIIVKERTQEIGIRRAIGAKPRNIIAQILSESMTLTAIAGLAGISFAVLVLTVAEKLTYDPALGSAHFQLSFAKAVWIMAVFLILGTAAGIIPAIKAMRIKPIEALNDK